MTIDEAKRKIIFQTTLTLPGYEQLLPRARTRYDYTIGQILKEFEGYVLRESGNLEKINPKDLD